MKKLFLLFALCCYSIITNAQATDLVIDNQTPGWLSSKINYGDQQTVRNLKVTGVLNKTDLKFIGTLITSMNLDGEIDLSECNLVKSEPTGIDNQLVDLSLEEKDSIKVYRLPKSATNVTNSTLNLHVDTLYFDCKMKYVNSSCFAGVNTNINCLYLGEMVDSIPDKAFSSYREGFSKLHTVRMSRKTKYIGNRAFPYISNCNFDELKELEYLGKNAFSRPTSTSDLEGNYSPDSIFVPKSLKDTFFLFAFAYRDGQHIFIENNIKNIDGLSWQRIGGSDKQANTHASLLFHINNVTPPTISNYYFSNSDFDLSSSIVYVPKGAKAAYEKSSWSHATIIETNPVVEVSINLHEITMNIGEHLMLSATVLPLDADNKKIAWSSKDNDIITVNKNGEVTAIESGQTYIYATSVATGIKDSCYAVVRKNVSKVQLNESQIVLSNIGETKQLVATITPEDATDHTVSWSSSNESVCTVSSTGLVTAIGAGTAVITVTTVDEGHTANCVVKVLQHVNKVELNKGALSIKVGESERLQASISPNDADNTAVEWFSSDEQVATVDASGIIKALKAGEAWVKAVSNDNENAKDSCLVTVIQPVTGITLSEMNYELNSIGQSVQLKATVLPEDASNKAVTWKSSNETICIVNNGNVVALGYGVAVVMATTVDGNFVATCVVTVKEQNNGIDEIKIEQSLPAYDLMGRKAETIRKGNLYIKDGKKYTAD